MPIIQDFWTYYTRSLTVLSTECSRTDGAAFNIEDNSGQREAGLSFWCLLSVILFLMVVFFSPGPASAKSNGDSPLWYSVQLDTYSTAERAKNSYSTFAQKFSALTQGLRVERVSSKFPLRVGTYSSKAKAAEVAAKVRSLYKGAYVVHVHVQQSRLVYPESLSEVLPSSHSASDSSKLQGYSVFGAELMKNYLDSEKSCYTIQISSPETKAEAVEDFNAFRKLHPEVSDALRIERISNRYAIRAGVFESRTNAAKVLSSLKLKDGPYVLTARIISDRMVTPEASSELPVPVAESPAPVAEVAAPEAEKVKTEVVPVVPAPEVIVADAAKQEAKPEPAVESHDESDTGKDNGADLVQNVAQGKEDKSGREAEYVSSGHIKVEDSLKQDLPEEGSESGVAYAAQLDSPETVQTHVPEKKNVGVSNSVAEMFEKNVTENDMFKTLRTNATALAEEGLFPGVLKTVLLYMIAAGCLFVILREFFRKEPDMKTKMVDLKHETILEEPRLVAELEQRIRQNINQSILAEENLIAVNSDVRTIYITSSAQKEGKTVTALSLAYSLSKGSDNSVLLVDGSVGRPELHELLGTRFSPGLADVIAGTVSANDSIIRTVYSNLSFMPLGGGEESGKLDNLEKLRTLLKELSGSYRFVIFDGASMWGTPRTAIISSCFDGVVLAVEAERTRWEIVQNCREKIQRIKGNVLGIVLTKRNFYIPRFLYGKL